MWIIGYIIGGLIVAPAGLNKRIGFWKTFLWSLLLSPFIALFIAMSSGRKDARGCNHCGNEYNEVEFCGICKKNEEGNTRKELGISL